MIFGFRSSSIRPNETQQVSSDAIDFDRLIDISLMKLSFLQCMGKMRTERQIVFVLQVLQQSLYHKSLKTLGEGKYRPSWFSFINIIIVSVADLIYYFEQEIYSGMMRCNVDRLPKLWIDLPGGLEKAKETKPENLPFRIKASFTKRK